MRIPDYSLGQIAAYIVMAATLLTALTVSSATPVFADDKRCTTTLTRGTFENVIVPWGECVLTGSVVVKGNIKQTGGSLVVDGIPVGGNVQAEGGRYTKVLGANVEGDVQIKKTKGLAQVAWSEIDGDVQVEEKKNGNIRIVGNDVREDVQVWKNTGGTLILIKNNDIGGNLQCKENTPNPTQFGNTASDIECND